MLAGAQSDSPALTSDWSCAISAWLLLAELFCTVLVCICLFMLWPGEVIGMVRSLLTRTVHVLQQNVSSNVTSCTALLAATKQHVDDWRAVVIDQ
jgi:hypothetical protein